MKIALNISAPHDDKANERAGLTWTLHLSGTYLFFAAIVGLYEETFYLEV
jgi:hypothetical protein